jgi:hypothetical protein
MANKLKLYPSFAIIANRTSYGVIPDDILRAVCKGAHTVSESKIGPGRWKAVDDLVFISWTGRSVSVFNVSGTHFIARLGEGKKVYGTIEFSVRANDYKHPPQF